MCEPVTLTAMQTLALGASATAGVIGAVGQYQQGQVAKQVGRNNAIMAEYAAQDAIKRGDEQAASVRRQADQLRGRQRATMAAKGLDLGVGTSAELIDQTDFFGQVDQVTSRENARRDAWAARASGNAALAQGNAAARQANIGAFSTLLGTAGSVHSKWRDYGGR